MVRLIAGVVVGIVAWMVTALLLGRVVGMAWPDFAAAARNFALMTVPIMAVRLGVSGVGSLLGGYVAALVGGDRLRAPLIAGVLLLLAWSYYHVTMIWNQFPVWYHLTFFASLPLLSVAGGRAMAERPRRAVA